MKEVHLKISPRLGERTAVTTAGFDGLLSKQLHFYDSAAIRDGKTVLTYKPEKADRIDDDIFVATVLATRYQVPIDVTIPNSVFLLESQGSQTPAKTLMTLADGRTEFLKLDDKTKSTHRYFDFLGDSEKAPPWGPRLEEWIRAEALTVKPNRAVLQYRELKDPLGYTQMAREIAPRHSLQIRRFVGAPL